MMDRIDELGYMAWEEYYSQMAERYHMQRPGKSYWHDKYYKAFRIIGSMCNKHDVDPVDYITVNLETLLKSNHRYVTPRDFANTDALDRYRKNHQLKGDNAASSWMTQAIMLADFESRMIPDLYSSEEELLANVQLPFTSWFRIMYPEQFSTRLFSLYGDDTYSELRKDKKLRDFLRKRAGSNMQELERRIGRLDAIA